MSTRLRKVERFDPEAIHPTELLSILTSFRDGNFSVRLPAERTGIAGKIYDTLNQIIDMSDRLDKELNRINKVAGKEGKLTNRASLPGATGSWLECVESVKIGRASW